MLRRFEIHVKSVNAIEVSAEAGAVGPIIDDIPSFVPVVRQPLLICTAVRVLSGHRGQICNLGGCAVVADDYIARLGRRDASCR